MSQEMITDDGELIEVLPTQQLAVSDSSMASALVRAEIDSLVATAKQYPRSIKHAMNNILSLATLDQETATECIYALKRSGKLIRGPSIRLADIIASQWGNCRDSASVIAIDRTNKLIVAEGTFIDLETNRGTKATVQRRISDKNGRIFGDDMITVTGNAACSIARRNAILAGVPKGIWRRAQAEAEKVIAGSIVTLGESREKAIAALAHFGLSPEQVFRMLDVGGVEDIDLDAVATLRVVYGSLKNGEQTVEELLRGIEPEKPKKVGAATADMKAPAIFDTPPAQAEPPKEPESAKPAEPAKAPESKADAEPDDRDTIVSDLLQQIRVCNGNAAAVKRVLANSESDLAALDEERRKRVHEAAATASKRVA